MTSPASSMEYSRTDIRPTLKAASGPRRYFAIVYWPPASGMTVAISETIITCPMYMMLIKKSPTRADMVPPCCIVRFHPMNSPTRTIPTPSAQTWTGPSVLKSALSDLFSSMTYAPAML